MATTPYISSITIDSVMDALGAFLQPFVGSTPIIRAQVNRVSSPVDAFVEMTEILQVDLETPTSIYVPANDQTNITGPKRIDIQVDFYGATSGDQSTAVKTVFRSEYCAEQFPGNIQPLYCSDSHQAPLITGEEQYENRWTLTVSLQYNPFVAIPQQAATEVVVTISEDIP